MTPKRQIGLPQIQRNARNVTSRLRKMVDAIIWYAKIKIVKLTSVGCVSGRGNHTVPAGIIVIVTMKKRLKPREMLKKNRDPHYRDIYFTVIDI